MYTNGNWFAILMSRVYFGDWVTEIHYFSPLNDILAHNSEQFGIQRRLDQQSNYYSNTRLAGIWIVRYPNPRSTGYVLDQNYINQEALKNIIFALFENVCLVQWVLKYLGDLKSDYLKSDNIWNPEFLKVRFHMVEIWL